MWITTRIAHSTSDLSPKYQTQEITLKTSEVATFVTTTRLKTSQCSSKFFESTAGMRAWDTMEQQLSSTIEK